MEVKPDFAHGSYFALVSCPILIGEKRIELSVNVVGHVFWMYSDAREKKIRVATAKSDYLWKFSFVATGKHDFLHVCIDGALYDGIDIGRKCLVDEVAMGVDNHFYNEKKVSFPLRGFYGLADAVRRHAIGYNISHRPRGLEVESARDGIDVEHLACKIQVGVLFCGQCV